MIMLEKMKHKRLTDLHLLPKEYLKKVPQSNVKLKKKVLFHYEKKKNLKYVLHL